MKKIIYVFLVFQALVFSTNAFSQDIYLKVTAAGFDFNGGATTSGYQNSVELFSFSEGLNGCVVSSKTCATTTSPFNFMTRMTHAITDFRSVMLQGKIITSADMYWVRPLGEGTFVAYQIHMEDVKVSSLQESGSGGGDITPTVSVSLQPARIAWKVVTLNQAGQPQASTYGWDFAKNAAFAYAFPQ
jgi:type VI protein secretion system component Hcp